MFHGHNKRTMAKDCTVHSEAQSAAWKIRQATAKSAGCTQWHSLDSANWCPVVRFAGSVSAEKQCVSREGALRAVTLDAAYSLGLEHEVGSIVPGKLADFTILGDNPVTCPASRIKDIAVWGTVHEGRKLPVKQQGNDRAALGPDMDDSVGFESPIG